MRLAAVVAAFVVASLSVGSAQSPFMAFDTTALGWGHVDRPQAIETDGDIGTLEFLIASHDTGMWRVVTLRPAGMCAGGWFHPTNFNPFGTAVVERVGLVHKYFVRAHVAATVWDVKNFDTPVC